MMAYINEYKNKCTKCGEKGDSLFARMFYKKVLGAWMYLCKKCWEKED